jgi:EAL domain-containing protein (putative c-di-GMP-specific phosphodiesterase class I)
MLCDGAQFFRPLAVKRPCGLKPGQASWHPSDKGGELITPVDYLAFRNTLMHDALMKFLLQAPVGLVQMSLDGSIERINPMAEYLLLPWAPRGRQNNLFVALTEGAPQLRALVAAFEAEEGIVCEALRIACGNTPGGVPLFLFVSICKVNAGTLLATLSDSVFDPAVLPQAARRRGLGNELRQALAANQLFVQYQPVVGLGQDGTGLDRGAGVEALVRWNHRLLGAVSPLEFIGVAEECGLSGALGDFVLRTACRQFAQWQKELGTRAPRSMAVNASRGQILEARFVDSVGDVLHTYKIPPEHLQIEVNESLVVQDADVQARLRELRSLGVIVALDNFGGGHSSLTGLHLLPVDLIKIHRSFISQSVSNAHFRLLIEATVRIAESLRLGVAAEGIETESQLTMATQLGCVQGQGFFFSEAISSSNVVQWLTLAC